MTTVLKSRSEAVIKQIPFIDLKAQQARLRAQIDLAIQQVLDHGKYIMGPEVLELEKQLANYCGAKHAISCSSGTDALLMALMAKGVVRGDAVFIPSFTFPASPEVVALLGAEPVFVDVDPNTFNIDSESLIQAIKVAKKNNLKPTAIIAVDLYGQPADYKKLAEIAQQENLWILADAAQSFGATLDNKKVGTLAQVTATSFFPAKPLGCYGDGGAIFTDDHQLAEILKSLRVHGKGQHKYDIVRVGLNARLDTIQAAILLEKLKIFDDELKQRQQIAKRYNNILQEVVEIPKLIEGATSAWAQYTVRLPNSLNRSQVIGGLKANGIPSMVYYPKPLHIQLAYKKSLTATEGALPNSEKLAETVLSLPMTTKKIDKLITSLIYEKRK